MSAGAVKVAIVHKAIRGRRAGATANQKAAAIDSSQHETKRATMSGALSTSASSLGSEAAVEESILDSSRNPVRKKPDRRRTGESPDRRSSNEERSQWAGKALTSDAAAGTARNPKRVRNIFGDAASADTSLTLSSSATLSALVHAVVTSFVCTSVMCFLCIHALQAMTFFQKRAYKSKNENCGTTFTCLKTTDAIFTNTLLMSSV